MNRCSDCSRASALAGVKAICVRCAALQAVDPYKNDPQLKKEVQEVYQAKIRQGRLEIAAEGMRMILNRVHLNISPEEIVKDLQDLFLGELHES